MQIVTFKLRPKQIFGAILAITGITVIILTFVSNHNGKPVDAATFVSCSTEEERKAYLTSLGYTFEKEEHSKNIVIPSEFNDVYKDYNNIQKQQGFNLEKYKGKSAVIYTYNITNYKNNKQINHLLLLGYSFVYL